MCSGVNGIRRLSRYAALFRCDSIQATSEMSSWRDKPAVDRLA